MHELTFSLDVPTAEELAALVGGEDSGEGESEEATEANAATESLVYGLILAG